MSTLHLTWRPAYRVAVALLTFAAVAPAAGAQDNGDRSTSAGVFTDAQARRGQQTFQIYCMSCHAPSDYTGDTFKMSWVSQTAFDLFESIRTQMPEDAPASLQRQEYADVVAYIFSLNKYPAGSAELPTDEAGLRKIKIDAPPGAHAMHGTSEWSRTAHALPLRHLR